MKTNLKSVDAFIKALSIKALSLASIDVLSMRKNYDQYVAEATEFLEQLGIKKTFAKEVKNFINAKMEFTEDDGAYLNSLIKEKLPKILSNTDISQERVALIKDLNLFFKKDSAPAWARINKNISLLRDSQLTSFFNNADEDKEQETGSSKIDLSLQKNMAKIVEKLTGRKNDHVLTLNEMRDFRESNPKDMEKYSELRKEFVPKYRNYLLRFVRNSGKDLVKVEVASKYLEAMGANYIPKGFQGYIDEKGTLYTTEKKQIQGNLIGEVTMNPKYDPKADNTYVCYLKSGPTQRLRTVAFLSGNRKERFEKVQNFVENIDKHRKDWTADLSSIDPKKRLMATIVETIYYTHARIGGEGNETDGKSTYGISTVLVKHLKKKNGALYFDYPGKKGTMQHHVIKPDGIVTRKLIKIIDDQIANKGKEERVFTHMGKPIKDSEVRAYIKALGITASIHKFRHAEGTKMAEAIIKTSPFKKGEVSQAAAEKWLKEAAKKIGEVLHHRSGSGDKEKVVGTTALAAYVDPSVTKKYFSNLGLRVPKWVPKVDD